MTATTGEVLAAVIRANGTGESLRRAIVAMTRDGGDESAPSWGAYLAALEQHAAASAAADAAVDSQWDDDAADCAYCDGTGGSGVVICGHCDGTGTT